MFTFTVPRYFVDFDFCVDPSVEDMIDWTALVVMLMSLARLF